MMLEDLQAVVSREKKRLVLELQLAQIKDQSQQLWVVAARSDRLGAGGFEARGATVIFWSGAGAEDQHHQSPARSYPGFKTTE